MYTKAVSPCYYFKRDLFHVHTRIVDFFFKLERPFKFWKANIWHFISCDVGSKGLRPEASCGLRNSVNAVSKQQLAPHNKVESTLVAFKSFHPEQHKLEQIENSSRC